MTLTNTPTTPDRVYGEIYQGNGIYWAEIIVTEDGFDRVVKKSADFSDRKLARAWLAEHKIELPQSFEEALIEGFHKFVAASFWSRLRNALSINNGLANAN